MQCLTLQLFLACVWVWSKTGGCASCNYWKNYLTSKTQSSWKKKNKQYSCYAIKTRAMVQNNLQCSMVTLFLCLTWSNTVQGFTVQLHLVVYRATYRDLLRFHTYRTRLYALWTSAKTVYFFLTGTVHVCSWVKPTVIMNSTELQNPRCKLYAY